MSKSTEIHATYEPREMFAAAERYGIARMYLATHPALGAVIEPWVVLSALSLEIFLKCLIILDGNSYQGIHDLLGLFNRTKPDTQKELEAEYQKHLPEAQKRFDAAYLQIGQTPPSASLQRALGDSNGAFVNVRYPYEKRMKAGGVWMATDVAEYVREIILKRRPDWANMQHNLLKPPAPSS